MSKTFASEGFDLDAIAAEEAGNDFVYEIGGVATAEPEPAPPIQEKEELTTPTSKAEEWKQQGNQQFKQGLYLEAYDLYTEAIDACPGECKGEEILKRRDDFFEAERVKQFSRHRQAEEERRKKEKDDTNKESTMDTKPEPPVEFKLDPPQEHGNKLAVYYCNRAASLLHMERYDDAIKDCDVSLLLNSKYTKAFVRRSVAYEKSERTEDALRDAQKALELEPKNAATRKSVARLQKIEDARLEKLKDETMGKS
jgi:tetratricopeptide (TPR) repeat protein